MTFSNYLTLGNNLTKESSMKDFLKTTWVQHTIFWLIYFTFNLIRWGSYFDDYQYSLESNLVEFPLHIILVYFNLYFLLPRLIPKYWGWYFIFLMLSTLVISIIRIVITYEFVTTEIWKESGQPAELFGGNYILAVFIGELYVVGLTTALKLGVDWVNFQKKTRELERLKMQAEMAFLQSQIQPHFFFNTLNNLYSLVLVKSDKAADMIIRLSDLMRYVIYGSQEEFVSTNNAFDQLDNYVELVKLRYGDKLSLNYSRTEGNESDLIPPLTLLPFIENSFKHAGKNNEGMIPIKITIEVTDNHLIFKSHNFKQKLKSSAIEVGGVGNENVRKRLELLFSKNYSLDIKEDQQTYFLRLKIPLKRK
ncbi:sensor histidine kinase [Marinigracilibium pacificum]|uniref:Histidine kinase n=1 Tax=Marinigracilibium pacificum TaxID=2729599 RepID=A0A848JAR7_9BACT|nr:histidine kinase [Marinigracilibium pacificum]NMM50132.1 histidine kinase [Marinigracilibium pacificum]